MVALSVALAPMPSGELTDPELETFIPRDPEPFFFAVIVMGGKEPPGAGMVPE